MRAATGLRVRSCVPRSDTTRETDPSARSWASVPAAGGVQYIQLGDLKVSRLGFGCDQLGGHAWGRVDPAEVQRSVETAVDLGVTLFDTADCYGRGRSEIRLGQALGARRKDVAIATKFGVRLDRDGVASRDNSAVWFEKALAASLRRLRTDYIDLYQVHYWDGTTPWEEIFTRLERKREAGVIRWYGVTNELITAEMLPTRPMGCVSCSFEFSLANRSNQPRIESMRTQWELGFLSWGSLGQGVLSGKYASIDGLGQEDRRRRPVYANFRGDALVRNLGLVEQLRDRLFRYPGATTAQIAIRWILDRFDFSIALVGAKTRQQARENAGAVDLRLTESDIALLSRLTSERAPSGSPTSDEPAACDARSTS
jgi:aryl-alcohol dehydrogenase-like predicted oxidoreductase